MAPSLNVDKPMSPMVFEEAYFLTPVHGDFSLPIKTIVYSVKCELMSSTAEKKAEEAANRDMRRLKHCKFSYRHAN